MSNTQTPLCGGGEPQGSHRARGGKRGDSHLEKKTSGRETSHQAQLYLLPLEVAKICGQKCLALRLGAADLLGKRQTLKKICIADTQADLKVLFPSKGRGRPYRDRRAADRAADLWPLPLFGRSLAVILPRSRWCPSSVRPETHRFLRSLLFFNIRHRGKNAGGVEGERREGSGLQ